VVRALTEVNQFLPFIDRRDAQGNTRYLTDDPETLAWCREATVEGEPWVAPDPAQPARTLADYPALPGTDLAEHVAGCVGRVEASGLDVMVLDQTRPDLDLAVVKVVAPGLRHFWRRLGPGRLYTAPVRLGWLAEPYTEDEINPRNIFF
jgi:oxazoline/thiazoline synthase